MPLFTVNVVDTVREPVNDKVPLNVPSRLSALIVEGALPSQSILELEVLIIRESPLTGLPTGDQFVLVDILLSPAFPVQFLVSALIFVMNRK